MSVSPGAVSVQALRDEADLCEALRTPFSVEQLAAITAPLEPGVIIAGAGSGKTTVMAARVVWLVGTGAVRPEEVLGLTFTRKAAAELSQRVRRALSDAGLTGLADIDESGEQLIMTYDSFAGRLVAEHGLRLGFDADPTMITGATRYRLAARVVKEAAGPFEFISRLRPATVTERVLRLDSDLQQHLVERRTLDPHARDFVLELANAPLTNRGQPYVEVKRAALIAQERLELASLVEAYQQLKQRLGLVEFADQMAIAARLAAELPEVSTTLRSAFRVVLLDEYQDTSAAQATMLRGLFSGNDLARGLGHAVTAVGDPFQAIYGWRGAAASNITHFASHFPRSSGRKARRFALTVNRRSGQRILDLANVLSAPLRSATFTADESDGLGFLRAPGGTPDGTVRAATFTSWPEEVAWLADQVVAVRETGVAKQWADIAVLTRRNADIGPLYAELTGRDVPVEIVGLGGLLELPEIADLTATLRLVDDVTSNPDLVRLLGGPRWRIGHRDLALLGRRARELAAAGSGRSGPDDDTDDDADRMLADLEAAVADIDPADVVCLLDALEDPGELAYSPAARRRFAQLAGELGQLRRHSDDPLLDLVRRVIATLGLDVEVMATPALARASRRDQLGAFLDAVADFVDVDGDASLSGLLAYLKAETEQGLGLEQAVPSDREAVKLLTVHKAKGLEWEVVCLPALMRGIFPSDRVTDNWVTNAAVLPAELRGDADAIPQLAEATQPGMTAYKAELSAQQQLAEDRLAYVAATRAKQLLVASGHWWRPDQTRPRVPSAYLHAMLSAAAELGELVAEADPPAAENPLITQVAPRPWPAPLDPDAAARRFEAATLVSAARERYAATGSHEAETSGAELLLDGLEVVAGWDADLARLSAELVENRQARRQVLLPEELTTTELQRLAADPAGFAAGLARPLPRPPSRAARFGSRFHDWVEQRFAGRLGSGSASQGILVDPDDLLDRADTDIGDEGELRELARAFATGQFGDRAPYAVEEPFAIVLAGRRVRGRIDAVYLEQSEPQRFLVVDWKTNRAETADPLQLAIYRLAWAQVAGVAEEQVAAAFYYVRTDTLIPPESLAGRTELAALLTGPTDPITLQA